MAHYQEYTALLDIYLHSWSGIVSDLDEVSTLNDFLAKHNLKTRAAMTDQELVMVRDSSDDPTEDILKQFISEVLLLPVYDDADLYLSALGFINQNLNYVGCNYRVVHYHKSWDFVKVAG